MEENFLQKNKKFISSKEASRLTKYTSDYIGQLCREGKIVGEKRNRTWYVSVDSLFGYIESEKSNKLLQDNTTSSERYSNRDAFINNSISDKSTGVDEDLFIKKEDPLFPTIQKDLTFEETLFTEPSLVSLSKRVRTPTDLVSFQKLVVGIAVFLVAVVSLSEISVVDAYNKMRHLGQVAVNELGALGDDLISGDSMEKNKGSVFTSLEQIGESLTQLSKLEELFAHKIVSVIDSHNSTSSSHEKINQKLLAQALGSNLVEDIAVSWYRGVRGVVCTFFCEEEYTNDSQPVSPTTQIVVQQPTEQKINPESLPPVIVQATERITTERVVERTNTPQISIVGISREEFESRFADMQTEINGIPRVAERSNPYAPSASSLVNTAAYFTATSDTASSTFANGINLTNGCFSVNGTCITGGGGGSGTPGGSDSQIQYNDGGSFNGASGLVWDDSTNFLGIGTTSPYAKLSVAGQIVGSHFTATSTSATSTFAGNAVFATGGGFVGIGTTNPQRPLHVKSTGEVWFEKQTTSGATDFVTGVTRSLLTKTGGVPNGLGNGLVYSLTDDGDNVVTAGTVAVHWADNSAAARNSLMTFSLYKAAGPRINTAEMVLTSTGLGIGSSSPYAKLSVAGQAVAQYFTAASTTATSTLLRLSSIGGSFDWLCLTGDSCITTWPTSGASLTGTAGQIAYFSGTDTTVGTSSIFIATSGNVGIGTTSPYAKLSVAGQTVAEYFSATSTTATSTFAGGATFATGGGNVGIGTTTPLHTLTVAGDLYLPGGGNIFIDDDQSITIGPEDFSRGMFVDASNDIIDLYTLDSDAWLRLQDDASSFIRGNVGIGTTSPYAKLSVAGETVASHFTATTTATSTLPRLSSIGGSFDWLCLTGDSCITTWPSGSASLFTDAGSFVYPTSGDYVSAPLFTATSTTATSTFAGGLAVETNGLVYDYSSGNVGIGTAAPSRKLSVSGGSVYIVDNSSTVGFEVNNTGATYSNAFIAGPVGNPKLFSNWNLNDTQSDASKVTWGMKLNTNADRFEVIRHPAGTASDNGNQRFVIDASGDVAIGANETTPDFKLEVVDNHDSGYFGITESTDGDVFIVDNARNVGIGTTSPYAKLSVSGETVAEYFSATSTTATSTFAGGATFATGGGNVGIGTTTTSKLLTISGTYDTGSLAPGKSLVGIEIANRNPSSPPSREGTIVFSQFAGINTSQYAAVSGIVTGSNAESQVGDLLFSTKTNVSDTSLSERMRILSTGNVGIGTTSPYAKLSVSGETVAEYFTATSTTATSTLPRLSVTSGLSLFGTYGDSLDDFCSAITGSSDLCDGSDAGGGGGGDFAWTPSTYAGSAVNATTTGLWLQGTSPYSLIASSTFITNASTTNLGASGYLAVAGNATVGGNLTALGDMAISVDGSSQVSPRIVGFTNLSAGEAMRLQFGDAYNGFQSSHNNSTQIYGYYGIEIIGDRQDLSSPAFAQRNGTGLRITSGRAASDIVNIKGVSGQSGEYLNISSNSSTGDIMTVTGGGDVGISTSAPLYRLHVATSTTGSVAGFTNNNGTCTIDPTTTSLSCSSDARLKKDVASLDSISMLQKVVSLNPVNYRWLRESSDEPLRIGFIAQEMEHIFPEFVTTGPDGKKAVSYGSLTPVLASAIQAIHLDITATSTMFADGTPTLVGRLLAYFKSLGVDITEGLASITNLVAEKFTVGSSDKPTGITLYDETTGDPYCFSIKNGQPVSLKGECGHTTGSPVVSGNSNSSENQHESTSTTSDTNTNTTETATTTDDTTIDETASTTPETNISTEENQQTEPVEDDTVAPETDSSADTEVVSDTESEQTTTETQDSSSESDNTSNDSQTSDAPSTPQDTTSTGQGSNSSGGSQSSS